MKTIKAKTYDDMCRKAANIISAQVIMKPNAVLGLATGSTPIGIYKQLVEWYNKGDIDFSEVRTVNLDEYKNLENDHPQSYHYYMKDKFFKDVNVLSENIYIPDGCGEDDNAVCQNYDEVIKKLGGIDLQLLGIGHDGHIGFNEPGTAFELGTHLVKLSEMTINANKRFFESKEDVPKEAYTMGIKSIMQAKKVLLVASGEDKKGILIKALTGEVTPMVPASILQMHPDLTVVTDVEI